MTKTHPTKNNILTFKIFALLFVLFLVSCTAQMPERQVVLQQTTQDLPAAKASEIVMLNDGDSYTLTAELVKKTINGKKYTMMGYNGQIPGPRLMLRKGSNITINFVNNLHEPTTVHWHGLRHDIKDDGVPGISQEEVQPGDSYMYTLRVPDSGTFWYHPHVREDKQQDLGLYGLLYVADNNEGRSFNNEEFIILDDLLLEENQIPPYGQTYPNHALMGRFGNTFFINGELAYELTVNKGDVVRFHFASVSNVRPYNLRIPQTRMKLIGSDLSFYEQEQFIDTLEIHPGERYTVDVYFEQSGTFKLIHSSPHGEKTIGTIQVTLLTSDNSYAERFTALTKNDDISQDIRRYESYFSKEPDFDLELTIATADQHMNHGAGKTSSMNMNHQTMTANDHSLNTAPDELAGIEWEDTMPMMNSKSTTASVEWIIKDKKTDNENMDIKLVTKVGDVKKLKIFNNPNSMHPMQHPIHIHGQRFLVISIDGKPVENLVWKDTFALPIGSTAELLVEFTSQGKWMLHCHIAEHLHAGMMTAIEVME